MAPKILYDQSKRRFTMTLTEDAIAWLRAQQVQLNARSLSDVIEILARQLPVSPEQDSQSETPAPPVTEIVEAALPTALQNEQPPKLEQSQSEVCKNAPVKENFNEWIVRQPGFEIETYVLDEESGELLEQQQLQQPETSTLATKQQAKRNRRLNQAKKSGALSGKGFAISTQKSEIEEKKLLYKNAEILFAKENAKLRKRYADLMQEVLLTCTPGKLQLFEDVTKVCNDFLGSTLKYTTSESGWEAYLNSKTYYRDFVEGKIPASKAAGGINDQFLSLIFEGLECWIDCYLTVQFG